ncbi:isoprenoid synthase domain-containing protein [Emericellopsis cladophorae]|uniref:Isoprenoid synthase domain-containing protein n=1 Tax=Emericellopsis cladophorae TaxID=2686198 RepID=A0A9P9XTV1_9HYPO|nr:isoprenoid synthase domain-containing protein [Emericellopsis cladophorae]KAI6777686.1 isoprenoid synthase domain-containing protein [Emericellopsis cladophorae]
MSLSSQSEDDDFRLGAAETNRKDVQSGQKQIQAKMMLQLSSTDPASAKRVMDVWKTMLSTTLRHKTNDFGSLDEYLDFRIVDTGAPFVAAVMLFGMGMVLTDKEHDEFASVVRPCFASEWDEAQEPGAPKPVNAVWLYMQWQGVDIASAKLLVLEAASHHEKQFLSLCDEFRRKFAPVSETADRYLRGLSYQISGNVIWSLNCPRYHSEYRYDPNAVDLSKSREMADEEKLGQDHLEAPFHYTSSLPSKGVRDTLVDALGLWSGLSEDEGSKVKDVIHWLHTASLMLDDIEDGSELRRGSPAAHTVFGAPQTINSASFAILEAVSKAKQTGLPNAVDITLEQLRNLHVGQSYDLYWTRHAICPSEEEYLEMVSKKTGGLFQLLWQLISSGANNRWNPLVAI